MLSHCYFKSLCFFLVLLWCMWNVIMTLRERYGQSYSGEPFPLLPLLLGLCPLTSVPYPLQPCRDLVFSFQIILLYLFCTNERVQARFLTYPSFRHEYPDSSTRKNSCFKVCPWKLVVGYPACLFQRLFSPPLSSHLPHLPVYFSLSTGPSSIKN